MSAALLAAAGGAAVADWWSVHRGNDTIEAVAKPVALALMLGAALAVDPSSEWLRWWFVVGLAFSLVGDVALLPRIDAFVVGLGSFLVAHLAYVIGMARHADSWALAVVALAVVVAGFATIGRRVLGAAGSKLRLPVATYLGVLSMMFVAAYATGSWVLAAGGLLFAVSDALLGYRRFVGPVPGGRVFVHLTYHIAQALLVIGLR